MLNFWKSKPTITEKILEQNKIKIIPKADIKIDKSSCIAVTGSGTFYKGLYKNEAVSIKVMEIIIFR